MLAAPALSGVRQVPAVREAGQMSNETPEVALDAALKHIPVQRATEDCCRKAILRVVRAELAAIDHDHGHRRSPCDVCARIAAIDKELGDG